MGFCTVDGSLWYQCSLAWWWLSLAGSHGLIRTPAHLPRSSICWFFFFFWQEMTCLWIYFSLCCGNFGHRLIKKLPSEGSLVNRAYSMWQACHASSRQCGWEQRADLMDKQQQDVNKAASPFTAWLEESLDAVPKASRGKYLRCRHGRDRKCSLQPEAQQILRNMPSVELEGGGGSLTLLWSWQLRVYESLKEMFPCRGYGGQAHLQIK